MKILVIEDSPYQIEWAKQCFKSHDLLIATSKEEFLQHDLTTFDFIVSDIFLPHRKGEEPVPEVGMMITETIIELASVGKITDKWSVLSDLDRHIEECRRQLSLVSSWAEETRRHSSIKKREQFVVGDMIHLCSHFLTPEGEIFNLFDENYKQVEYPLVLISRGMKMLKPYDRVFKFIFDD